MKTFYFVILLLFLGVLPLFASITLEVNNGILIETIGSTVIEIDGNLIEAETGYLKGKISSGPRTAVTSFAGLTLSSALDGTIIRTTGSAYAKGNGEGTNFKRFYEIDNSGDVISPTMQINYVASGVNDELNSLASPFFIYKYTSDWTGYGEGASSSPVSATNVEIPLGTSDWVISEGVRVATRIFLEGPYDTGTDQMSTSLASHLPTTSPYTDDARTVTSVPTGITDWVLVQVRSTATGAVLGARSCFLKADGKIVADDGATTFIGLKVKPGDYYIVIRHRNHLAVMTASEITGLTWGVTPAIYDFTTGSGNFYGSGGTKELESGVWGMWSGDINQDKQITTSDYTLWYNSARVGDSGYQITDINLDAQVTTSDYTIWYNNARAGASSQAP